MNIPFGPWKSARWWRDMTDVLDTHFAGIDRRNPLFGAMLPFIGPEARRNGFGATLPEGSAQADDSAWLYLREPNVLRRKGFRVKTKTWFEVTSWMHAHNKEYYAWLYALCVLCHAQGHFKTLADMPIFGSDLPPGRVSVLPGDPAPGRKAGGGARGPAAGQKLSAMHACCSDACVVAALCQGQQSSMKRAHLIVAIVRPVWTCYDKDTKCLTTKEAVCVRYSAYALFGQGYVAARIWETLRREDVLTLFESERDAATIKPRSHAYAKQKPVLARKTELPKPSGGARSPALFPFGVQFLELDARDAELASSAWPLSCDLVKHRSYSSNQYTEIPPWPICSFAVTVSGSRSCSFG